MPKTISKTSMPFMEATEAAIKDIELRSQILAKMKKTKLYQHQSPEQVMRNAFNTVFKLLMQDSEDTESLQIADQQKVLFDEALEKLKLAQNP